MKENLTRGTIWKNLLLFAIPLLLSSLVQQLYNTVDLIFVGNFINKSASAAIGASSLLVTCLVGFFGGMSVGSGVIISQIYGAGDHERLKKAVHNAAALSLAGGVLLMAAGYLFAPVYLKLVNTPEELQASAVGYLRIYFLSFISVVSYNIGSGVCRALGDSKSPLYAQIFGGLMNVLVDYVFIRVLALGVNGAAWATLISQTAAAAVIVCRLLKTEPACALRPRCIRFDGALLKETLRIGIPAGTQSLVITLSNVIAQYHINSFGEDSIAAFTAYFKVELLIYLPIVAFGQAVMTFVGQNVGAKQYGRAKRGTLECMVMSMGLAAVTSAAALLFGPQLFRIFNREASVIQIGCQVIGITFPFYLLYSVLQILGDSLRGAGQVRMPMLIVTLNICVIRTCLMFLIVPQIGDIRGVAVTYPITWGLTAVCMAVCYVRFWSRTRAVRG